MAQKRCDLPVGYLRLHTYIHTHTEYVILLAFPLQHWLHERTSIIRYTLPGLFMDCYEGLFKPLRPTGHVMHQQFNIQQLYALPTLYLCVLYLSENKQRLVPLTA